MQRRSFLTLSTAAALGTTLPSCIQRNHPPLRIGAQLWLGNDFLYLAEAQKFWDTQQIQRLDYPSSLEVERAYRNEQIDIAGITIAEALQLMGTHPDTRIFLIVDLSYGNDVILGRPNFTTLKELKGRKIGLEAIPFEYYVLTQGLSTVGLTLKDVELVPLAIEEQEVAFEQGIIDGLVTFDPVRTNLLQSGARLLFDSRQIPGELADVLVTRTSVIQQHEATLKRLVEGWFQTLAHFDRDPIAAAKLMAQRQRMTPEAFLAGLRLLKMPDRTQSRNLLSRADPALYNSAAKIQQLMVDKALLKHPVNVQQLFTAQFIQ